MVVQRLGNVIICFPLGRCPTVQQRHARGSEIKAQVRASRRENQPQCANRFGANHNDPHVETPRNKSAKFCFRQTEGSDLIYVGFRYNYQHRNHIFSCVERQRDLSTAASVTSCSEQSESSRSIVCHLFCWNFFIWLTDACEQTKVNPLGMMIKMLFI